MTGKRELLARLFRAAGVETWTRLLPQRPQLLILTYHRIGDASTDLFDPCVFSATANDFDEQVRFMKKQFSLATLEEAIALISGTAPPEKHCRVLFTFDDCYLDNYTQAFPILRSHGAQGVFFIISGRAGSCDVPWWDRAGWILRTARNRKFTFRGYPVDIDRNGVENSSAQIAQLFILAPKPDTSEMLNELAELAQSDPVPHNIRRYLNWDEAREMIQGGMAFGSHTHTHPILSQVSEEQQTFELTESRRVISEELGPAAATTIAYPVGYRQGFTERTCEIARQAGYSAGFSFYGGVNFFPQIQARPYDVVRVPVSYKSPTLFRVEGAVCSLTGRYWP